MTVKENLTNRVIMLLEPQITFDQYEEQLRRKLSFV